MLLYPFLGSASVEISDGSVLGLYHFDGDSVDATGHGYTGTDTAIFYSTTTKKLGTTSSYFSGSAKIQYPTGLGQLGTNDFSVVFWYNGNVYASQYDWVIGNGAYAGAGWWIRRDNTANTLDCGYDGNALRASSTVNVYDNQWHHIVCQRASGQWEMYVDGTQYVGATGSGNLNNGTQVVQQGLDLFSASKYTQGYFDEQAILTRALTPTEISALYNSGAGDTICITVGCSGGGSSSSTTSTNDISMTQLDWLEYWTILSAIFFAAVAGVIWFFRR